MNRTRSSVSVIDEQLNKEVGYADSQQQLIGALQTMELRIRWAVARARADDPNPDDAFRGLYVSDDQVDALLSLEIGAHQWAVNGHVSNGQTAVTVDWAQMIASSYESWQARTTLSRQATVFMALDHLVHAFDLTPIELDILLIVLAAEIDLRFERLYAYLQDDVTRKRPSINLILNLLSSSPTEKMQLRPFLSENGRLCQQGLIQYSENNPSKPESSGLARFVYPPTHLVNFLLGESVLDPRLTQWAQLIDTDALSEPARIPTKLLEQLQQSNQTNPPPIFALIGQLGMGKKEVALHLAAANNQPLLIVDMVGLLASDQLEPASGLTLALRDGRLLQATLYCSGWDEAIEKETVKAKLWQLLRAYPHTIVLGSHKQWQPQNAPRQRPVHLVPLPAPNYARRLVLWQRQLEADDDLPETGLQEVANHFRFTPGQIEDVVATARDLAAWEKRPLTITDLFSASRSHSNQNLNSQATKIHPRYQWDDIVLPNDTRQQLQEMVNMVQQRPTVYGRWGFGRKLALGKGLNALFAGESGTGKTMAADIMAGALGLDLYKIDLSSLVSKYIGETEKNLERIFSEASTSNAILFFDEADAIFGKRSEVKDSHDRYANIEISYLLQRMEAYDGVVILATNMRANLDDAFTRRLHFAIEFPFPEAQDRERIWRVNIPAEMPIAPDVDYALLAQRFRLAGGNIRNIILAAAFLAAEASETVQLHHFLHATRREYQKMGRLIDEKLFV